MVIKYSPVISIMKIHFSSSTEKLNLAETVLENTALHILKQSKTKQKEFLAF